MTPGLVLPPLFAQLGQVRLDQFATTGSKIRTSRVHLRNRDIGTVVLQYAETYIYQALLLLFEDRQLRIFTRFSTL
jgi:hypothetical protein